MSYTEKKFQGGDGLSLYYREYGGGSEVVMCLPGLTRNSKDFHELAERLSSRYRVLCPDFRGRGQSDYDPKRRYFPGVYAKDCWRMLDELAIQRVRLVGTSLGGLVSMIMSEQQPGRVAGVVLNDIGPEVPPEAIGRIMQYVGRDTAVGDWDAAVAKVRTAYELAVPGQADEFWVDYTRRNYREDSQGKPVQEMDPAVGEVARNPPAVIRCLLWMSRKGLVRKVAGASLEPWETFKSMNVPCLLIRGAISDVLSEDIVSRMQALKPNLEVLRVPERGHAPLLDEPGVAGSIEEFLAKL